MESFKKKHIDWALLVSQLDRIEAKLDQLLARKKKPKARVSKRHECGNDFYTWYEVYPKKVGKAEAVKAWSKAKSKPSLEWMLHKLAQQTKHTWVNCEKKYIPNPATYLNQEMWEDEILRTQVKPSDDPDKQHHATYDPKAKVEVAPGADRDFT